MTVSSIWRRLAAPAALLLCLGSGFSAAAQDRPPIRIAVEGAFPPFNYMDNNELQGFEVDLGKALCDAMKTPCTFVQHDWEGIMRGLNKHEYDAVMSSLEITEHRLRRVAFSKPYYRLAAVFIAPKGSAFEAVTPAAMAGKKIGVADHSDHAEYLRRYYTDSEIVPYSSPVEAELDLLVGRVDAVFSDEKTLTEFLKSREGECCRIVGATPGSPPYRRQFYGVGLRKDDGDLKVRFDRAIDQVVADGTYDRIRTKYFPFDIKSGPRPDAPPCRPGGLPCRSGENEASAGFP